MITNWKENTFLWSWPVRMAAGGLLQAALVLLLFLEADVLSVDKPVILQGSYTSAFDHSCMLGICG